MAENAETSDILKNKIVILGGNYRENSVEQGADIHKTPLGDIYGVELLASVVETEMAGGGIRPMGTLGRLFFNFLTGIVIMFVFHRFSFFKALFWSTLAILIVSILVMIFYGNLLILPALFFILIFLIADAIKDRFKERLTKVYDGVVGPAQS
jgi:CHASE2 domain-containing sensor protein